MNELSPEAKELLALASGADDPSADDKARVKRALLAAAAVGVASGASVAAAGTSASAGSVAGSSAAAGSSTVVGSSTVGSSAVGSAVVGSSAVASAGVAGSSAAATVAAGASSMFAAKVAVVLALVGTGAVVVTEPWDPSEAPASASSAPEPAPIERAPAERPREASIAPPVEAVTEDAVAVVAADRAPIVASAPTRSGRVSLAAPTERRATAPSARASNAAHDADTLAAELVLLRRARSAHAAGDGPAALAALAEHEASFPRGVLRAERDGTRALVRCATSPRASIAAEFVGAHPGSPLVARVRAACEVEGSAE